MVATFACSKAWRQEDAIGQRRNAGLGVTEQHLPDHSFSQLLEHWNDSQVH